MKTDTHPNPPSFFPQCYLYASWGPANHLIARKMREIVAYKDLSILGGRNLEMIWWWSAVQYNILKGTDDNVTKISINTPHKSFSLLISFHNSPHFKRITNDTSFHIFPTLTTLYKPLSTNHSLSTTLYQPLSINQSLSTTLYQQLFINYSLSTKSYISNGIPRKSLPTIQHHPFPSASSIPPQLGTCDWLVECSLCVW